MNEIQSKILLTFKKLVEILSENDIKYFVVGGTLLGAVRHKGYIPWDDDIDILIPRSDYTRLVNLIIDKKLQYNKDIGFDFTETSENYRFIFGKAYDPNTTIIEGKGKSERISGVHIDIFPLDKSFESKKIAVKNFIKIRRKITMNAIIYDQEATTPFRSFLKRLLNPIIRIIYPKKRLYKLIMKDIIAENNAEEGTPSYLINYFGVWREKEIWNAEWFKDGVYLDFEDMKVRAPSGYHEILTHTYGNYMELPPVENQVSHHDFTYINLDKPYKSYIAEKEGKK